MTEVYSHCDKGAAGSGLVRKGMSRILLGLLVFFLSVELFADGNEDGVYVDDGVLRWKSGKEVALFGVNYNVPFAFTYRAVDRLSGDHEAAIAMDVAHLKRLGVDAYRVHLWDREISDRKGNLLENEHLRMFDFLMAELKKNDIKIIITAIAWWGSGYPEPDPEEPGFSAQYTKSEMNQEREVVDVQKKYLRQLLNHRNQYTNTTYKSDPDIIAIELFNEPKHRSTPAESAAYIEELVGVVRATGLEKPVFYNISEQGNQQQFATAVCDTSIDGIGYQWYPTGLVRFSTLNGNMLPTVQRYTDVFSETGSCNKKVRMIYEFDAADVDSSVMYPAMARSFREAGFQWATMFSYDPAVIAHTNAEYNTHYLNLLYTPGKAVSFLIAGEVFRNMPRHQNTGRYPKNNKFMDVTVDYHRNLSVLNSKQKFYYSNNTEAQAVDLKSLRHIAGVGSSPIVEYGGSGAYFLDKIDDGVWQLEVYPDLQKLQDPHLNSSLRREVGRLYRNERMFKLHLPDLGREFHLEKVDDAGPRLDVEDGRFRVGPGIYLLSREKVDMAETYGSDVPHYFLPESPSNAVSVWHQPRRSANVNDELKISAQVGSEGAPETVELLVRYRGSHGFSALQMRQGSGGWYHAGLAEAESLSRPGPLEYAIVVKHEGVQTTFPDGAQGSPRDWDFVEAGQYWTMTLGPAGAPVDLYDAGQDRKNIIYPQKGRVEQTYVSGKDGLGTALRLEVGGLRKGGRAPLAHLALAKDAGLTGRTLKNYDTLAVEIRSLGRNETVTLGILDKDGLAYATTFDVDGEWERLSIPLKRLKRERDATILPIAYPTFMPGVLDAKDRKVWPKGADLSKIQGLQFSLSNTNYKDGELEGSHGIEIYGVKLVQAE